MKLINLSIYNYRSIIKADNVNIKNFTVLVGKNNQGKSNVLKALELTIDMLKEHAQSYYYFGACHDYRWERDFPKQYEKSENEKKAIFKLEFQLYGQELDDFLKEFSTKVKSKISIEFIIKEPYSKEAKVYVDEKESLELIKLSNKIAKFIINRISFTYIEGIRTYGDVKKVIDKLLNDELRIVEENEEYRKALEVINRLQQNIFNDLADKIKEPIKEFVPNLKEIVIPIHHQMRRMPLERGYNIVIDDGNPTNIEYKGDGVQSLVALALLRYRSNLDRCNIVAIEEPESHLHPSAMNYLHKILFSLSQDNQVIITTHNSLFIVRDDIEANLIVNEGDIRKANNVKEIRDVLGIKASDNLINASYVLVVEGENDRISLEKILTENSEKISKALKENVFKIQPMNGSGNLSYIISNLKNTLCLYHVLLDNDNAGKNTYENAKSDGLLNLKDVTFTNCMGMSQSEFEDCLDLQSYKGIVYEKYGVDLDVKEFNKYKKKWSETMKFMFQKSGKVWNSEVEKEVKNIISEGIRTNHISLDEHRRMFIDVLIKNLENIIKIK